MRISRTKCKNCFSQKTKSNDVCPVCGFKKGAEQAPALPRGTTLEKRYVLGGCIGRGGFGITYLAYDAIDRKTVAVKEYFPSMLAIRGRKKHVIPNCEKNAELFNEGAEKFFDEAELVRQFNGNPNIVSINKCFYENNTAYFIMEYLDGITLEDYVKNHGVLNPNQAAYIADKLTMALAILHSGGVLHRDISPDNLMLCKDKTVKLIDFGAARQCAFNGTRGYTVMMKTGFSPMEQYSEDCSADVRSDIYSAGTLLYYALTGKIPETPYKRLADDSAFRENAVSESGGLWNIIEKASAIMPAERYKSAEDFRRELSGLGIKPEPIEIPSNRGVSVSAVTSSSLKKRVKPSIVAVAAAASAIIITAIPFVVNAARGQASVPEGESVELVLDSEYAGHFNLGGKIPASELKRIGGDVEITLNVKPWEGKESYQICGLIPVNSDDRIMLPYLFSPDELWADGNGWLSVDEGVETVKLVLSEEGVESLGKGELCFEMYNLIITSAELKRAEKKQKIKIDEWYDLRNATYSVSETENGKIVEAQLSENRIQTWPSFESEAIPKSAFFEIDGDVKLTLDIESLNLPSEVTLIVHISNSGYNFDICKDKFLVPAAKNDAGIPLVKLDHHYGMMIARDCTELVVVLPESAKEKMSSGVFFQCMGVKIPRVRLEAYNGEFEEFL